MLELKPHSDNHYATLKLKGLEPKNSFISYLTEIHPD